jgi:hypothetical protein
MKAECACAALLRPTEGDLSQYDHVCPEVAARSVRDYAEQQFAHGFGCHPFSGGWSVRFPKPDPARLDWYAAVAVHRVHSVNSYCYESEEFKGLVVLCVRRIVLGNRMTQAVAKRLESETQMQEVITHLAQDFRKWASSGDRKTSDDRNALASSLLLSTPYAPSASMVEWTVRRACLLAEATCPTPFPLHDQVMAQCGADDPPHYASSWDGLLAVNGPDGIWPTQERRRADGWKGLDGRFVVARSECTSRALRASVESDIREVRTWVQDVLGVALVASSVTEDGRLARQAELSRSGPPRTEVGRLVARHVDNPAEMPYEALEREVFRIWGVSRAGSDVKAAKRQNLRRSVRREKERRQKTAPP